MCLLMLPVGKIEFFATLQTAFHLFLKKIPGDINARVGSRQDNDDEW